MTTPIPRPSTPGWHVDPDALAAYRDGHLGPVPAASLEAHVLRCADCREALAAASDVAAQSAHAARWAGITDQIDRPERAAFDRRWWIQVTAGSPLLLRSAALLVVTLAAVPLLLALESPRAAVTAFWALAPVVPLVGVALAYRREIEPAGALAAATPMATLPLLLVRSLVVFAVAAPVAVLTATVLPVPLHLLVGWVVPGLALPAIVLAVGTRVDPTSTAAALSVGWSALVVASVYRLRDLELDVQLERSFVNSVAFQAAMLAIGAIAAAVYWARRDELAKWTPS
jgi:hypothetical protein